MKKLTKILTIVLLVAMMVMVTTNVFAEDVKKSTAGTIIDQMEQGAKSASVDTSKIASTVGTIIAYLRNAAVIIGVIIIIILGIKYMTGSVEEKAGYQKSFVPLIVGIVIVMAATSIAAFLFDILG